jgi:hypothetical protein
VNDSTNTPGSGVGTAGVVATGATVVGSLTSTVAAVDSGADEEVDADSPDRFDPGLHATSPSARADAAHSVLRFTAVI